ncbi:MAG TPA: hypothetical protein VEL76_28575 [Gemmataceae bacterium]|nr:hypothetical protein [Gemmataceae bacterium]
MTEHESRQLPEAGRAEETAVPTTTEQSGEQAAQVHRVVIIKNGKFVRSKRRPTATARAS